MATSYSSNRFVIRFFRAKTYKNNSSNEKSEEARIRLLYVPPAVRVSSNPSLRNLRIIRVLSLPALAKFIVLDHKNLFSTLPLSNDIDATTDFR